MGRRCAAGLIDLSDVIGVTLGTGVGGGILTGGRLLEGARGLGGELGHYRTHALDGVDCTCGAKGCWERYAATTALVRAAQEKDGFPRCRHGMEGWPRHLLPPPSEAGDKTVLAQNCWTHGRTRSRRGFGALGMVHIFNPQLILIGGGVRSATAAQPAGPESSPLPAAKARVIVAAPLPPKVKAAVMPAFAEGLEKHRNSSAAQVAGVDHCAVMPGWWVLCTTSGKRWKRMEFGYEKAYSPAFTVWGDSNTHGYCADPQFHDCADHGIRFNEDERWIA